MKDIIIKGLSELYQEYKDYLEYNDVIVYEEDMPTEFIKWLVTRIQK